MIAIHTADANGSTIDQAFRQSRRSRRYPSARTRCRSAEISRFGVRVRAAQQWRRSQCDSPPFRTLRRNRGLGIPWKRQSHIPVAPLCVAEYAATLEARHLERVGGRPCGHGHARRRGRRSLAEAYGSCSPASVRNYIRRHKSIQRVSEEVIEANLDLAEQRRQEYLRQASLLHRLEVAGELPRRQQFAILSRLSAGSLGSRITRSMNSIGESPASAA